MYRVCGVPRCVVCGVCHLPECPCAVINCTRTQTYSFQYSLYCSLLVTALRRRAMCCSYHAADKTVNELKKSNRLKCRCETQQSENEGLELVNTSVGSKKASVQKWQYIATNILLMKNEVMRM